MRPSISLQAFHERRKHRLRLENVTKRYADGTRALDDVSLSLMAGLTGVIGPAGAGKSTLLNIIGARQLPDRGTVSFGEPEAVVSPALLRNLAAHVPTDAQVPPPVPVHVALEHFASFDETLGPQQRTERIDALLQHVQLWDARRLRVGELTRAMHGRLMLAIALLGSPRILLLDEPGRDLDRVEARDLLDILEATAEHRIVVVATAKADLFRDRCAHVAMLHRGRIVREGAVDRLIDDFRGRVWETRVRPETVPGLRHRHRILSTQCEPDAVTVVVLADEQPGAGFVMVEPELSHVYQYDLAEAG